MNGNKFGFQYLVRIQYFSCFAHFFSIAFGNRLFLKTYTDENVIKLALSGRRKHFSFKRKHHHLFLVHSINLFCLFVRFQLSASKLKLPCQRFNFPTPHFKRQTENVPDFSHFLYHVNERFCVRIRWWNILKLKKKVNSQNVYYEVCTTNTQKIWAYIVSQRKIMQLYLMSLFQIHVQVLRMMSDKLLSSLNGSAHFSQPIK